MDNGEALKVCEEFGSEVLSIERPQGQMLEILIAMKERASDGTLEPEFYQAYMVAMAGFRQLFFGDPK